MISKLTELGLILRIQNIYKTSKMKEVTVSETFETFQSNFSFEMESSVRLYKYI